MKKKIALLESEKTRLNAGMSEMDKQCSHLTEQITQMSQVIQQRMPIELHDASIRECKQ